MRNRDAKITASPDFLKGGGLTGARSRAAIQRVVMQNMITLRYEYVKRLREKKGLSGKITIRFAIDEFGQVIFANMVESTINDAKLEKTAMDIVKNWKFGTIDYSGDVTEVTYPFIFADDGFSDIDPVSESNMRNAAAMAKEQNMLYAAATAMSHNMPYSAVMTPNPNMLNAAAAAQILKLWWNTDFTPQKINSPASDKGYGTSHTDTARNAFINDKDYLSKLTGKTMEDERLYLKIRKNYADSPAFYFDMADWFYTHGDKETALRVLTSIADIAGLEPENAPLYRMLGYRLKEYGEYALEKFACKKVFQRRPMEPQSHRDYALALADNGEAQAALDSLYGLLTKTYSNDIVWHSSGIEEAVIMEINQILAKNANLNTSKIDKNLIMKMPVDIRVVINWSSDNAVIDLHVVNPNNENCYPRRREMSVGWRINADIRERYGPEQFLVKNALRGKYRVYAEYYSDDRYYRAPTIGTLTVMAEIFTMYADKTEQRKVVCLRIPNAKESGYKKVEAAEFEF